MRCRALTRSMASLSFASALGCGGSDESRSRAVASSQAVPTATESAEQPASRFTAVAALPLADLDGDGASDGALTVAVENGATFLRVASAAHGTFDVLLQPGAAAVAAPGV